MAENKTTLNYNEDETVLTIEVNEKQVAKYNFTTYPEDFDYEQKHGACAPCVFLDDCSNEMKCMGFERKDKKGGYYVISEQ